MLDDALNCDEELVRRLPLPLAQLYRRGHNAKSALERHQAGYYLWEASLKLLGSVAIVEYAALAQPHDPLLARLQNIARPSTGHWWEFVRCLTPALAEAGDAHFAAIRDLLLGRSRDDLPRAAGLDAALCEALDGHRGARATVRLSELFDRLIQYRNRVLGHGAAGQHTNDFYERMGRALLSGVPEILGRLDVLASRQLIYVREISGQPNGGWLVDQFALNGETARRIRALDLPAAEVARLPRPERVYLAVAGEKAVATYGDAESAKDSSVATILRQLHPFLLFDSEAGEPLFFSARRGADRFEYLCYSTGRVLENREPPSDQLPILAHLLYGAGGAGSAHGGSAKGHADEPNAAAGAPISATDRGPARLGEFELLSELGRGGMGVVYRAWQPSLGRQVALKSMLRSGDPKAEARFSREIKALGRVDHPHLVKIFTSASEADHWFYSMELVEGATLAAVCEKLSASSSRAGDLNWTTWRETLTTVSDECRQAEKPLGGAVAADSKRKPPTSELPAPGRQAAVVAAPAVDGTGNCLRQWVELARQLAEAAQALHEAGVIHRDIKPGNVMLTANGSNAVLMDLGLAQLNDDSQGRLTRTRQFVGTLRYASPEQVLAAGKLDTGSDVYSLGATLWELLTLRPMFGATDETPTPQLMHQIQFDDPEPVRRYNKSVPRDLEAVVLKCLEKDPRRRYATARELAEDLDRWLAGRPVVAERRTAAYVFRKFVARHRAAMAGSLLAAFVLLIGYLGLCDAGVRLPGGHSVRSRLDQWGVSLFRPIASDERLGRAEEDLRKQFESAFLQSHTTGDWFSKSLNPQRAEDFAKERDVWSHSQAVTALLKTPANDDSSEFVDRLRRRLAAPFDPRVMLKDSHGKYVGWAVRPPKESYAAAEPALWTAASLAVALHRPNFLAGDLRKQTEQHFAETVEILKQYRPLPTGGWNMYPSQTDPGQHNDYVGALALLALLEARRANLPWEGTSQRRDELLATTAQWLISTYDSADDPPGWRASAADNGRPLDGLTLQIYSLLLRAESEADVKLPETILQNIPRHLARCGDRNADYPDSVGKFVIDFTDFDGKKIVGSEPINFLWYPWAIDCGARWLDRRNRADPQRPTLEVIPDEQITIRRALAHLVIDLGPIRAAKAPTEWTFIVSESLYCLSDIATLGAAR
jgi:serine/threonine protein kinase